MAKDTKSPFDIPVEMQAAAERGIEQARAAFDRFLDVTKTGLETAENRSEAAHEGARDFRTTVVTFAQENMTNTFDFVQKSMVARDPQELMQLQIEFIRTQMQGLTEQAKILGETVTRAATELPPKNK